MPESAAVDSAMSVDLRKAIEFFQFNCKNPHIDQLELTRLLVKAFGYDENLIKVPSVDHA